MEPSALGLALALLGGGLALGLGGAGSSIGIGLAGMTASGVVSEDPKKFGRLMPFVALPGTQGIYGFVLFFIIAVVKLSMLTEPLLPTVAQGWQLLFIGFSAGIVLLASGMYQGKVSAAAIGILVKKPDQAGKGLVLAAFVETYAVIALVAALLVILQMKIG